MKKIFFHLTFLLTVLVISAFGYLNNPAGVEANPLIWERIHEGLYYTKIDFSHFFRKGEIYAVKISQRRKLKILTGNNKATSLQELAKKYAPLVIVNGGYFQENYQSAGLLIVNNKEFHGFNRSGGSGILAINKEKVDIFGKSDLSLKNKLYHDFLQNGPILVEDNGKMGIYSDDQVYTARTAICKNRENETLLVMANMSASPSLWELAELLSREEGLGGFGCKKALNLDGGSSSGIRINTKIKKIIVSELVPIANALAVF